MKRLFILLLPLLCLTVCKHSGMPADGSQTMAAGNVKFVDPPGQTSMEKNSDVIFRNLFAWHMEKAGFVASETLEAAFLTPPNYKQQPMTSDPVAFLSLLQDRLGQVKPSDWYAYGVKNPPKKTAPSNLNIAKPATVLVFPGIFGEFIEKFPFHEIVTDTRSAYYQKWGGKIAKVEDKVYSLYELREDSRSLGDLMKFGSYDIDGKPWVNVVLLAATIGSCESLGKIDSTIEIYLRRLDKFFSTVTDDGDLYFMGYSRGEVVALEMARQLADVGGAHPWARRVKGVIGLGGVYYGSRMAEVALTHEDAQVAKAIAILKNLTVNLQGRPQGDGVVATVTATAGVVKDNMTLWMNSMKELNDLNNNSPATDLDTLAFQDENKIRSKEFRLQSPSYLGNLNLAITFAFKTFRIQEAVTRYFDNIDAMKMLIGRTLEGMESLTPDARLAWWQKSKLPADLKLFSITGSMPDALHTGKLSVLYNNDFYGVRMADFNMTLRSAFYDVVRSEKTEINDSQVTWFNSRFWPGAFPGIKNRHYYLGMMGTHHWGMAFPNAVTNSDGSVNKFPRAILMASLASFIYELDKNGQ